jgi:hypothetical protein
LYAVAARRLAVASMASWAAQWHRLDANDASRMRARIAATPSTRPREKPARLVTRDTAAGSAGEMHEYELNGKLMYPMSVAASPSVAPQILIENASYGWTEELLDAWKARYHKDIFDMLLSASRRVVVVSFSNLMLHAGKRSARNGLLDWR